MTGRAPAVVGRDPQLAVIGAALDDVAAGQGGCLLLLGEAGAGKSALLREALALIRARGMAVLAGRVPPDVAGPPFGVVSQALRSWTRGHPVPEAELAPFAAGLRQALPEWPPPASAIDLPDAQLHLLALEGILRLVLVAARDSGAVVVLDDLHDADPETFDFIGHAASAVAFDPVLVLGTVRTGEQRPGEARARALGRAGVVSLVEVGGLDHDGVAAMVESALGCAPPGGLVADLVARTGGVPLLVEEILAAHLAAGTLRHEDGSLRWQGATSEVVPATIVAIVGEKLSRLDTPERLVLAAAAVLGRFDPALLAALTATPAHDVESRIAGLAPSGLLDWSEGDVAFRHALIRDAVAARCPAPDRRRLHRRAAEVLDERHGHDPGFLEERSRHREACGEGEQAARLLLEAGRAALARHGAASAEAVLRRSIDLAGPAPVGHEAQDVLVEALEALGRHEEALVTDRALLAGGSAGARRLVRMAGNAIVCGRLGEAGTLLDRAGGAGADPVRLAVLSALANLWRGDIEQAAAGGRRALALAEVGGDPDLVCSALDVTGRAVAILGDVEAAAGMFRRWGALAREAGHVMSHIQALLELGNYEFLAGGPADGLVAARALAAEAGAYSTLLVADLSLGWWLRDQARLEESVTTGDEAVALGRRFRLDGLANALVGAGAARNAAAWDAGEALLAEGLALAPGDTDAVVVAESSRGEVALRAGRFERAEERLGRATAAMVDVASAVKGPAPFQRVGALLALGREEEARAQLAAADAIAGQALCHMPVWRQVAMALLSRSPGAFEEALAPAAPFHRAVALGLGAEVLAGGGAHDWLTEALAIYEQAGAADDVVRIRGLLRIFPAARRERRTLMFTDIVGSTTLVGELGDQAWEPLLSWHDQALRALFAEHGGEVVKQVGDGFFVVFDAPGKAVECALAVQRAIRRRRREDDRFPGVRIGLHEAEVTRKGGDYLGRGVHEAARIGALGGAGEVVASRTTLGGLDGVEASPPRTVELKGIAGPVEVVTLDWE